MIHRVEEGDKVCQDEQKQQQKHQLRGHLKYTEITHGRLTLSELVSFPKQERISLEVWTQLTPLPPPF